MVYIKMILDFKCNGDEWQNAVATLLKFLKPFMSLRQSSEIRINEPRSSLENILDTVNRSVGGYIILEDPRKPKKVMGIRFIKEYLEFTGEPLFTVASIWRPLEGELVSESDVRMPAVPIIINGVVDDHIYYYDNCKEYRIYGKRLMEAVLDAGNFFIVNREFYSQ